MDDNDIMKNANPDPKVCPHCFNCYPNNSNSNNNSNSSSNNNSNSNSNTNINSSSINNHEILKKANPDDPKLCFICYELYTNANPVMLYSIYNNYILCQNCVSRYGGPSCKCKIDDRIDGNYSKSNSLTQTVVSCSQPFKEAILKNVEFEVLNTRGKTLTITMHQSKSFNDLCEYIKSTTGFMI
jgi:hypothetical protein